MPRSRKIKASAPPMITTTSLTGWKTKAAVLGAVAVALALAVLAARTGEQESARGGRPEAANGKRWQTVAPGRVEPRSGTIKIAAPVMGVIAQVLVKVDDKVFPGEPLIRLVDTEARARLASRPRPAPRPRGEVAVANVDKAATRRRAEDALADADKAVMEAQAAVDKAVVDRRAGTGSDAAVEAARSGLARSRERQQQQRAELRRIEVDPATPLPTFAEGQVNVARAEAAAAAAEIERLTIRAPIAGTVLQVNAKPGELAAPSNAQPLLVIGDVSALRVRAELDERDFGQIKIGQPVLVRAAAFRGREFAGKIAFIAPLVEQGRINARGQRNVTDVDVVEVLIDLAQPDPLAVGMKVDVYFQPEGR